MMRTRSVPGTTTVRPRGFTLVELIVAMVISAILVGMIAMLMGSPVERYLEQSKRNDLVNASERITRMMSENLKTALPNSVRVGNFANTSVLQMLAVTNVVFYRNEGAIPNPPVELSFNSPGGDTFDANGTPFSQPQLWLVVNNEGTPGKDAYNLTDVIIWHDNLPTIPGSTASVTLDSAFIFGNGTSPSNRMFGVSGPITYVCNRTTGILRRFSDHGIDINLPEDESAVQLNTAGTTSVIVATGVFACNLACSFVTDTTTNTCRSTVTFDVTMTRGVAPDDENLRLFQQFAVENVP